MKIIKTIQQLKKFKNASFPILSVYLSVKNNPGESLVDVFQKLVDSSVITTQQDRVEDDIFAVITYLKQIQATKQIHNIAIFSGGNNLWEVISHDFSIPSVCKISYSPYVSPLSTALQKEHRYLVILADREKAIYFTLRNSIVEKYEEFRDAIVPQKVKANKGEYFARNTIIFRHIENHLHRHLRRISHHIDRFLNGMPVAAVIVGGHKPLIHKVEKHLNPLLRRKIVGEFVSELHILKNEIVKQGKKAVTNIRSHTL
jgi:peptide subunit release factor 1 (eRF1)